MKGIIGIDQSGDLVLLTEHGWSDPSDLSALRYVILDYQGERIDWMDGRFWLQRVVFLSGLQRNLALYQVVERAGELSE